MRETAKIEVVKGVGGLSVYINDYRVAGQKPWGGGKSVLAVLVAVSDIKKALAEETTHA